MAGKTVEEIFKEKLDEATVFTATTFASVVLINDGKGRFNIAHLPAPLQWSPVFAFTTGDFNKDGKTDFLAGGNFYGTRPYEGRYDAMPLTLYYGENKGRFRAELPFPEVLKNINGEVRCIQPIGLAGNKKGLLIGINNSELKLLEY